MPLKIVAQHAQHVRLRLATMDDHRLAELTTKYEVTGEIVLLHRKWREIPVAVEAGFTDGYDLGPDGQRADLVPVVVGCFRGMIWVNAGAGRKQCRRSRERDAGRAGTRRGGNRDDVDDAGRSGTPQ